jgi:hypothetical protein
MMYMRNCVLGLSICCFGLFLCGCTAGGGGNDGASGDRPNPGLNGFFREDEAWALQSDAMLMLGYGDHIEAVLLASSDDIECLVQDPEGAVVFDGESFSVSSEFRSFDTNQNCAIDVSARADQCAAGALPGSLPCALADGVGEATFSHDRIEWTQQSLIRFSPCREIPSDLSREGQWGILNVHPLPLLFLDGPEDLGAIVLLAGDSQMTVGSVVFGFGETEACADETPEGTLMWDGRTLIIDWRLVGNDNTGGVGIDGPCTIAFQGTASYCALYDSAALNPQTVSNPGRLVRIDGHGTFTYPGGDGGLAALYLLVTNNTPTGGFGGPGIRR